MHPASTGTVLLSCFGSMRVWCLAPLLGSACADVGPGDFGRTGPGPDAAGLVPEEGCTLDDDAFLWVETSQAAVATVARVEWELREPASVWALFAEVGGPTNVTDPRPAATSGQTLLLGLPEDTELMVRLVAEQDGELLCSDTRTARTGWLPAELPELELVQLRPDEVASGFFVTTVSEFMSSPWHFVLDDQGRAVWAWGGGPGGTRTRLSRDRQSMLVLEHHKDNGAPAEGVRRVSLDGGSSTVHAVPDTWVDFVELPDGTLAVLVDDTRELEHRGEQRLIRGDAVVLVRPSGENEVLWSSFDAAWPDLDREYAIVTSAYGVEAEDWSHINGMGQDPAEGLLYLTSGGLDALYAVDLATGHTLWELSAHSDDWYSDAADPLINAPHSVQPLGPELLLVFNRRGDTSLCSEAVEIELDYATGVARRTWGVQSEDCLHVDFLGNAERLQGGDTLVSWSSRGRIDQLRSDGATVMQLSASVGTIFGFVQHEGSLYPPRL